MEKTRKVGLAGPPRGHLVHPTGANPRASLFSPPSERHSNVTFFVSTPPCSDLPSHLFMVYATHAPLLNLCPHLLCSANRATAQPAQDPDAEDSIS